MIKLWSTGKWGTEPGDLCLGKGKFDLDNFNLSSPYISVSSCESEEHETYYGKGGDLDDDMERDDKHAGEEMHDHHPAAIGPHYNFAETYKILIEGF